MAESEKDCDHCPEHLLTENRVSALENEQAEVKKVVEKNTATVYKLATRVGLLITIMSIGTLTVLGGTVYTFTAVSQFKEKSAEHRIALVKQLNDSQKETVEKLSTKMDEMERRIDNRMDTMSTKITTLETVIDQNQK